MSTYLKHKSRKAAVWILTGFAYFFLGKLGLLLAIVEPNTTALWAPAGVAIAAFIFLGYDVWPAIFIAALFINVTTANTSVPAAILIAIGDTLEGLSAAYLINAFSGGMRTLSSTRNVLLFFLFAGVTAPAIGATIGVASLALAGAVPWVSYLPTWTTWWLGDMAGAVIVAPLLLLWCADPKITWNPRRIPELVFMIILAGAFGFLIVSGAVIFVYLLTPLFVWAAFRFRQRDVAIAVFALTGISLWGTLNGYGPFIHYEMGSLSTSLLLLDASMVSLAITMLSLAATVEEDHNIKYLLAEERNIDRAALASIGEGLIVTNREALIVFMNPAAETLLNSTAAEAVGRSYFDRVVMQREDGSAVPERERPLFLALSEGKKITNNHFGSLEYYLRKDGGRFPVAYTTTPIIREGAAIGASEVFRDISREIEIDKAKSEFISFASHQLRAPLSVVGLSSTLLQGEGKLFKPQSQDEIASYVRDIQEATAQMNDIINNLLNVSRIESQSFQPVFETIAIENVVAAALKTFAPHIKKKRLSVTTRFPQHPTRCATDPRIFPIVLQNLLSNAVKYTPEQGAIDVVVTQEKNHAVLIVSDTGCGIPESEQDNVFQKLFRASNAKTSNAEGSGLGLYIVKAMIERLGGDVSLASKENEGTTFVVRLPVEIKTGA